MQKRLNKFLQEAGVASRRKADDLVFAGNVTVNGEQVLTPAHRVDPSKDIVKIKGKKVVDRPPRLYFMLNKPRGYLCTNALPRKNKKGEDDWRVIDLFSHIKTPHLFTVGRLDKESEGLLLVTNDGDFAQAVSHPSYELTKEYVVKVNAEITHEHLVTLSEGVDIEGEKVVPLKVSKVRRGTLKITLGEGKKREIRRLCESIGLNVIELKRVRVGPLSLGALEPGAFRELSEKEIDDLWKR